jgi:hypothetical protein
MDKIALETERSKREQKYDLTKKELRDEYDKE